MNRSIRIAEYGCGKMGKYLMRYALGKGCEIVAAFDINPEVIGKDVAEIIDDGRADIGIKVTDAREAEEVLCRSKADVCIVASRSTVAEIEDIVSICCKLGINVISSCEEALYPWNSSPELTNKLDKLAKEGNCTITGVGYCDLYWGTMVSNLAGSSYTIDEIHGSSSYNVEDYGIALAEGHGAGLSVEEFEKTIGICNNWSSEEIKQKVESGEYVPSYMWNQNGWLCSKLGLHVKSQTQKCLACTHNEDIYSSTLGMTIKAGQVTGMRSIVTTETEEGIKLVTECIGKVYAPNEIDQNIWTLKGEPDTTVVVNEPATAELTCATMLNRIPQLIDQVAGYVTTDRYPDNFYCVNDLHKYVKSK